MASVTNHYYHNNGGWKDGGSLNTTMGSIGPYDGNSKLRSIFKISLNSIEADRERTKLRVNLRIASAGPGKGYTETLHYALTSSSYNSETEVIQGTIYDEGNSGGFSSYLASTSGTLTVPEIEINTSKVPSSTNTVYLWVYANASIGTGNYATYTTQSISLSEDDSILKTSNVKTNDITTTSSIYKPTDTISVAWDEGTEGTNNPVTGYDAYLRFGSAPTIDAYNQIKTGLNSTTTSTSFDISNVARGTSVYVGVKALGSQGNGSIKTKNIGVINSLPSAPSFSASGATLNTTNQITYTVTAGSDSNSQNLTLYYSLNNGEQKVFTSPLTINTATSGVVSGSNSIVFYTFDTKEFSTASNTHTFTATFAPIIGQVDITHTSIADMNNSTSTYLASAAKIQFTMTSGTPRTVELYVRTGNSTSLSGNGSIVSNSFYTYNEETKTINIPSIAAITSIANGAYYQFAFRVSDGTAYSNKSDWQSVKRKPYLPRTPIYSGYNNHSDDSWGAIAKSNYYKENVTISFTNPTNSTSYAKISSVAITAIYGDSSKDYDFTYGSTSLKLNLSQVNANVSTTFKFKITDVAGQTQTTDIKVGSINNLTLVKSSKLAYGGNIVDVSNENLKPMTNSQNFLIYHPIAQASGTQAIVYKYNIKVGDKNTTLIASDYNSTITADQVQVTINADRINAIAKSLAEDFNSAPKADITVAAADGFADTLSLVKQITINFTEPPVFIATNPQFNIRHDYYTSNSVATINMGVAINTPLTSNPHLVNSGEGIVFVLPKASDPNDDIDFYRIYLARNDFEGGNNILNVDEANYSQKLIDIPYDTLLNGAKDSDSDGNFYYRYKTSRYSKNEYFYFKLQVIDKTGNASRELICPYGFVGCRTVEPTFSAGNVRVDRNGTNITLNYDFKITDLGGSATKNGWDFDFYDSYPNFERSINGYTPKASLVIEIAPNQDFKKEETISNASNPEVFTPDSNKKLYEFTHKQTSLSGFAESHAKIFMRFTLTVSYGLYDNSTNATVSSIPQVYTYFGAVPTVAHRAHRVGINTTSLGQDDVMVVENYQGTRYVRFKGTNASDASKTYEITFDLLNGTITGAVIDCGSW